MELAPGLGLCRRIVDLVSTGSTLKANDLVEVETIAEVTSRPIVNRAALKTRSEELTGWVARFREAADAAQAGQRRRRPRGRPRRPPGRDRKRGGWGTKA